MKRKKAITIICAISLILIILLRLCIVDENFIMLDMPKRAYTNITTDVKDLSGNIITNADYLKYISDVESTIESPTYTWESDGHTVTNIPIKEWTRSSNSVITKRLENSVKYSWNWNTINGLNEEYTEISKIWDASRSLTHNADHIGEDTVTIYNNVLYDAATWISNNTSFSSTDATEELYQFKGRFNIDPTLDVSQLYFTLTSVASDDKIYLNDNIYVFLYPECIEDIINSDSTSDYYFMKFLAYWCGTISTAVNTEIDFNGIAGNEAIKNEEDTDLLNIFDWSMDTVTDNVGEAIKNGYSLVKGTDEYDGDYILRIITGDISKSGGMYRQKLGCEFKTTTLAYVGNGGTGYVASQEKIYGEDLEVQSGEGFTRKGYIFKGWNTLEDGTGQGYNPGDIYSVENSTILYAQWEPINYIVKYNGN